MGRRARLASALGVVVVVGVGSFVLRGGAFDTPADWAGGACYVLALGFAALLIAPGLPNGPLWFCAFAATCAVEVAQLWHPVWLDAIRSTLPGRLALGSTFSWADFPPYAAGAGLGHLVVRWIHRGRPTR